MHRWAAVAAIMAGLAVALGALGAHALKPVLPDPQLTSFETAVRYQLFHAVALLAVCAFGKQSGGRYAWPSRLFVAGTVLFSGSIYLLSTIPLHGAGWVRALGPVTPIGGLALIAGWALLAVRLWKDGRSQSPEETR